MADENRAPSASPSRLWCVGGAEFDEARWELRVGGERRAVEAKPLALLHVLLCRAGEAVTKNELLEAVWPGVMVVEGSLTTAVSKLRAALGEQGRAIVEAVHGIGYRIGVPCELRVTTQKARFAYSLRAGEAVPNRPQWKLERELGGASASDVWLARHEKTGERRVFKFADTAPRLLALRREADLARVLHKALGDRPDLARVLEWNFDVRPYFIESVYGGRDLAAWAAERGGLAGVPLATRIGIAASVARIVGAAHGAGVLHRDIKPANILIAGDQDASLQIRLVDFGSGRLTDPALLAALSISGLTVIDEPTPGAERSGLTLRYIAPELVSGGLPSMAADVYATGILLYELVVGDLDRPLAAGWEAEIADPLLRQDIADAAAGDPARRLASALLLAERLDKLEARRAEVERQTHAAAAAHAVAERAQRMRTRLPWLALAAGLLVLGLAGVGLADIRAIRRGNEARRQAAIAVSVDRFLTDDLLARGDPERAGRADETLMDAASRAEAVVDRRFSDEPFVAGSIHLALAQVFDRRTAFAAARAAYTQAIADFLKAGGAASPDALIARLRLATMEAVSAEPGSKARAEAQLAAVEKVQPAPGRAGEAQVWRDAAIGAVELGGGDAAHALALFTQAADLADTMPAIFDESRRLWFRQKQAIALFRLGRWDAADAVLDALLPRQLALHGPHDADTLLVQLTQAQVLMGRGASAQAVTALDRLYPAFVATYGPDHRLTTGVLAARAQTLGQLGRYDEAIRDGLVLHDLAVARHGRGSWLEIATLSDVAESRCRAGHAEAGLATSRQTLAAAQAGFGAKSAQAQAMMGEVAFCLIVAGHAAEAAPLIDAIDPRALSDLGAGPDFPAQLDVMRAAIALSAHDIPRARALLQRPAEVFARPDADPYVKRWTKRLLALSGGG